MRFEDALPLLIFGKLYQHSKGPSVALGVLPSDSVASQNRLWLACFVHFEHECPTRCQFSKCSGLSRWVEDTLKCFRYPLLFQEVTRKFYNFWASCHRHAPDSAAATRCQEICSLLSKRNKGLHLDVQDTTTPMSTLVCSSRDAHLSNPDTPHGFADPIPNHSSQIVLSGVCFGYLESNPFRLVNLLWAASEPLTGRHSRFPPFKSETLSCRLFVFSLTGTSEPFRIIGLLPDQDSLCYRSSLACIETTDWRLPSVCSTRCGRAPSPPRPACTMPP
jgi:hypothetical protein